MVLIGVGGGIAAGKTVLMDVMKKHGFFCLDCDELIAWLYQHGDDPGGSEMKAEMTKYFGSYYQGGALDGTKLGEMIMDDDESKRQYARIIRTHTYGLLLRRLEEYQQNGGQYVVTDALQSLKDIFDLKTDFNVLVDCPFYLRMIRLRKRAGIPLRMAERYVNILTPVDREYRYILHNNKEYDDFVEVCEQFVLAREAENWGK